MLTFYLCFLAGGVVLPIVSAIFGFFQDSVDTDATTEVDMDVGTEHDFGLEGASHLDNLPESDIGVTGDGFLSIGFLPTSLMALSTLAFVFGAVGSIFTYYEYGKLLSFVLALVIGYLASVIVQTIVKSLRKVQTKYYGISETELLLYDGKVVDTILPGQIGTVSFTTLKNVSVSYPARCLDQDLKLSTGKIVKLTEFREGVAIVEAKNKYE